MATRNLRDKIPNNPQLRSKFNTDQLEGINSGKSKIPGMTWHHHQDSGRMQLVKEWEHNNTGHIGGNAISKGK